MQQELKLVGKFDQNGDGWLNAEERKAARASLSGQGGNRRGPGGQRGGFGPRAGGATTPQPGTKLTPADVKSFPDAPLYGSNVLRTFFLEFENADWEKDLADFKNTDVDVPAKLTVDGKVYPDVGVHFHGASSYMMVGEGQKRSLTLTLDLVHEDQHLGGYRKLNLLNSHEDPSFLRSVLALQIARDYLPAPKANFGRVVINGESWGLYVNQQHFNKEFLKEYYDTTKGARWKVPGSPNGRGGFTYLGDDDDAYKRIYEIKTKDDPKDWAKFIKLCKVLTDTPASELEPALAPLLDIDSALKFLAWDNVLANGDGFWTRASDYCLYLDQKGRFHIIPYDANETFSFGGGPGGMGGRGGFGPGMVLAAQILEQADKNNDGKLAQAEFAALGEAWFGKLDPEQTGKVTLDQFAENLPQLLPVPQNFGPPGMGGPGGAPGQGQNPPRGQAQRQGAGRGGFAPARFMATPFFQVLDTDKDGTLTRAEMEATMARWFADWDTAKRGTLDEATLRTGLTSVLPQPNFGGGPGGMGGGRGRGGGPGGGPGGFGGPGGRGGPELDPLATATDTSKPLLSKLLAVPSLRTRYLGYVRDMADKWLDWNRLGPIATQYHELIAADVKADTRKLDSTEEFETSLTGGGTAGRQPAGGRSAGLKGFADQRRAYLLNHTEVKQAAK
jgi:spore coat protein CotH